MNLTRRDFLRSVGIGAVATAARASGAGRPPAPADRPNILWITCEDISANLGCYGDAYARTPQLDALAARAVRYTNAYGITGVCAPNRSCLITGVAPSSLGSHDMRSTTVLPEAIKCFPEYLRKAGYYCTNSSKTDYNFAVPKTAWNETSRTAHWRKRKAGQPFFSVFNYTLTHESRIRQAAQSFQKATARLTAEQRHDPAKAPVPPFHPDTLEVRRDWANYHDLITALDYEVADRLRELADAGLAENTIVLFFSDHGAGMPGCKKWVWQSGLHVPLIVHVPEKLRRWAPGKAGSVCDRLVSFVDFAPTMLSLAGTPIPKHMQGTAFLGSQAGPPRKYVYGIRDRMAERYDTVRVVRDKRFQYMRNFQPHLTWSQFVSYTEEMPTMKVWRRLAEEGKLTGPAARYFQPTKPVEELYDNAADPHQIHNLAGTPEHRATLKRMRGECDAWMKRTGDLGLLPEYEFHRRAAGATPWDVGQDPATNPVDRLLEAADLAGAMDAANANKLAALLKDTEPAVRWWGAVGLTALGKGAAPAADALTAALKDDAPNVRIAAADALCNLDRHDEALPVLMAGLQHASPFIRLRALNVLDRIGEKARPALPQIEAAGKGVKGHAAEFMRRMASYVSPKLK